MDETGDALVPIRAHPSSAAVLLDFDGTLSPIVEDPHAARALAGVPEVLSELARRYAVVAVVSGRPVEFLVLRLPAEIVVSGLYGIESSRGGLRSEHPEAEAWRPVVDAAAAASEMQGPRGMRVERKGLSLTLHYRGRPELADAVGDWAASQAARSGLQARPAKMSVELHPPIGIDKGTTVVELCRTAGVAAACYFGDDIGDLAAFDGLDRLAADAVYTVRVVVTGPETPAALSARADVTVEGTEGALAALQSLLG